jgi:hypothetical protein
MNNLITKLVAVSSMFITLGCLGTTKTAQAADFHFFGNFTKDNDVFLLDFTVNSDSNVTIFSSSWDDGGFDPILAIWDSNGNRVKQQDDGDATGSEISNGISYNYDLWDTYFSMLLTPGSYTATIAQYNNFAKGSNLSNGFEHDGAKNENFTAIFKCSNGQFCDALGYNRTSDYAFHILHVENAAGTIRNVPEPLTILGAATAFGFGTGFKRKLSQKSKKG